MTHVMALTPGTELVGDFRIERVLGAGGFGITYLADEIALARAVTIKEYFPTDFAARTKDQGAVPRSSDCAGDYKWGLDRFIEEAQTLARFDHRNICRVYRYFRANNTGYMVLHFEEGASLKAWLKGLGRAPRQAEIDKIVGPLLDALEIIHKADFLHRDIAPDNIMVRRDGSPVLIDFGSARGEIAQQTRTVSALVKPGYSPYEQYAEKSSQQGPWTDIYAFAATLYHAISGKRPPDSPGRVVKDDYVSAKDVALSSYRPKFLAAIDRALLLDIERRPQSIAEWRGELLSPEPKAPKKNWLSSEPVEKPAAKSKVADLTNELVVELPPVPDAPGQKGGILDFFEGLKRNAASKPSGSETVALKAPPPPPAVTVEMPVSAKPGTAVTPRKTKTVKAAKVLKKLSAPPPPPARQELPAVLPRPRRMRGEWRAVWSRRAAILVLAAAGITSAAVGLKDRVPKFDLPSGAGRSSSNGSTVGSNTPSATNVATADVAPSLIIKGQGASIAGVGFTGDQAVSATSNGVLRLWNATTGVLQREFATNQASITSAAFLGRRAVTGHSDGSAVLWDLDRSDKIATFKSNEATVWSVAFAGSQDRVAIASHDWSITIWDAAQPRAPTQVFEGHESAAQSVAFSPRGPFVASGGADRMVKLWNMDTGALVRTYRGHKDFVTAVDFTADGRLLASAGLDGTIRVSSTASNRLVTTLNGHRGRVNALAFAPSGDLLASVGEDGAVRLWEPRKGRLVRIYSGGSDHLSAIKSLSFSANGRRLISGGEHGQIVVREIEVSASTAARAGKD